MPEALRMEPGDVVAGVLERYATGRTTYQDEAHIAVLSLEDGSQRALWLLDTVLLDEWRKQRPRPGDLVAVAYFGKKAPAGGGDPYNAYRLVVDRGDQPPPAPSSAPEPARLDPDDPPF
jgi:hypothetical protein